MRNQLQLQTDDGILIGPHAEWLLSQGIPLSEVYAFAQAVEDMRAVPHKIEVDCPDTVRDVERETMPSPYRRVA